MTDNKYNPRSYSDRVELANKIVEALEAKGFVDDGNWLVGELVLTREIGDTGVTVHVYTAVERQWHGHAKLGRVREARRAGADAIRVAATFEHNGETRGLVKTTRINRVGTVADIVDRMMRRTKEVWHKAQHPERCHCGAPKFVSKRGNAVCADFCWVEERARRRQFDRSA